MYDDITAVAPGLQPEEMTGIWQSNAFASCDGTLDKYGRLQVKNYKGLTVTLYPANNKLKLEGSLPTFANGNNLQLLTYSEMQLAIPALAAAVGLPVARLVMVGLELSLDIEPFASPQSFLQSLQHHKHSKFCIVKQRNGVARPLEYVASHANFNVKCYDKNQWAKQLGIPVLTGQHKLRYEIVMTRARPINALWNRSETTLADLLSPDFYAAAALELEQRWKEIVRAQRLDFTDLKLADERLLGAGANPEYWRGLKASRTLITYKRTRARYRELVEACAKRVGPDEFDQRFTPALATLLPPVATTQNDTFFHTFSLLDLPLMRIEREADESPNEREQERLKDLEREKRQEEEQDRRREQWQEQEQEKEREEQESEREWYEGPANTARCCQTCDAPITSHRKPETRYCGKKCRNAASNPGHNARRTLRKIESQWLLFPIREFVRVPEQIRAFVLAAA